MAGVARVRVVMDFVVEMMTSGARLLGGVSP
jgi:hypothetical protein